MKSLTEMTIEEIKNEVSPLKRPQLEEYCAGIDMASFPLVVKALAEDFEHFSGKFVEKGNKTAGLESRKVTGKLESVFKIWRAKTIEASKPKK